MQSIKKNILYGFLVWVIPFLSSFPFFTREGEMLIDKIFFKTIMIIIGTLVGVFLIVNYFKSVEKNYIKEGVLLGLSWLFINWGLDIVVLIPMANMTYSNYFIEIGLRYLSFPIMTVGIAYLLNYRHLKQIV